MESRFTALEGLYRQAIAEIADMRAREALKTQFLANISHDLRTPLTAVITHAEILRDGMLGELNERQLEQTGYARRVIVGAVVNLAFTGRETAFTAAAKMIVVRTDNDCFAFQLWIRTVEDADDV